MRISSAFVNLSIPNGLFCPYKLDERPFVNLGVSGLAYFYVKKRHSTYVYSEDADQTRHFSASDLGLHNLTMPLLGRDSRHQLANIA